MLEMPRADKKCLYGHKHRMTTKKYCDMIIDRAYGLERCGQELKENKL